MISRQSIIEFLSVDFVHVLLKDFGRINLDIENNNKLFPFIYILIFKKKKFYDDPMFWKQKIFSSQNINKNLLHLSSFPYNPKNPTNSP
ncbi:hypothetical protein DERF_002080 [Dermatophagoides farinae]|uniref:Uncharacterized protein n=1 Tax=Dermatophagoides farinae TaxID=6954 RepID=A0A922IAV3_DERFA|nr:hypothetical protein DERF_002080 [Dermatophagoides farinae]